MLFKIQKTDNSKKYVGSKYVKRCSELFYTKTYVKKFNSVKGVVWKGEGSVALNHEVNRFMNLDGFCSMFSLTT